MREDIYVELIVLPSTEMDREWNNSDRDTLLKQSNISSLKTHRDVDQVFSVEDELVYLRGVAGIGKSTLCDMFCFKWAKGELKNQANIDFIFKFNCREINNISDRFSSLEELFLDQYADIFRQINFADLKEIADRVLIIVDGIDELQQLSKDCCYHQLIFDLINPKGKWLKNHKSIVTKGL